jgi:hypothetical protein
MSLRKMRFMTNVTPARREERERKTAHSRVHAALPTFVHIFAETMKIYAKRLSIFSPLLSLFMKAFPFSVLNGILGIQY